jgi:hypothetical protein
MKISPAAPAGCEKPVNWGLTALAFLLHPHTVPGDCLAPGDGTNATHFDEYENPLSIDKDLRGIARDAKHPVAGPFEELKNGTNSFVITAGPVAVPR